ncbi:MAG: hypothetical protein R2793_10030, partial [Flavobacteriaceae bacterium]
GISPVQLSHRLDVENAGRDLRDTLHFMIGKKGEQISFGAGKDSLIQPLKLNKLKKGKGFIREGNLIKDSMDFSEKNYFPLIAQHNLMKRLFFPEVFTEDQQFKISEESREILKKEMSTVPRNNGYPEEIYYDSYGKFFIYGDTKERIPNAMKIYNKVGYAYGTLTETAYIVDEENGIDFLLSATLLVNNNGIFNDDTYEYDDIGIPFLAQFGRELYLLELEKY